tara:strand:- start:423 stop:653 length:231 start_codon:yes stop_codon:yes gene_type:complete
MMVKQLKIEFDVKDIIHNLSKEDRKELISELRTKLIWANHEKAQWGETPKHFKIWRYARHNPETAYTWIKEILSKS